MSEKTLTTEAIQTVIDAMVEGDETAVTAALKAGVTTPGILADLIDGAELIDDALVIHPEIWHADDGNAAKKYEVDSGEEAAQEYVDTGDWGEIDGTEWISVHVWRRGIDGSGDEVRVDEATHKIAIQQPEPECTESEHDWRSPHDIVGGLSENPGVWGSGGGVKITEVCMHCGCARHTDTWAQDPNDGEQGLTSVSYEEGKYADEIAAMRATEAES